MNFIKALLDKILLGQFLKDVKTWLAWFTLFKAFYALPPNKQDLEIYEKCTGRKQWPRNPSKELWVISGRRSGKSFATALIAAYEAAFVQHELSVGEIGCVIIVAPTKQQSGIIKRYLSSFFNDNVFLKSLVLRETTTEIELSNNITIMVLSSDFRSIRGFTAVCCIVDEIAFFYSEGSRPDHETIRALRPALATTGGRLIVISSPYAKRGSLYTVWKTHYGKDSDILVWQSSSVMMNPTLNEEMVKRTTIEDPDGAISEWLGLFRSDIESYIPREAVEAVVILGRYELPPIPGVQYCGFVDPSGGSRDSFTIAISHEESGTKILDAIREVKPPFSPDQVCQEFAILLKTYWLVEVVGDRYAGQWPQERFERYGITYKTSEKTKSQLYQDFLPILNSGQCELLDNKKMINQIINLERRTARSGKDSIDHPPGAFDDLPNVVAGSFCAAKILRIAGVW